ncbi:hypothetical protein RHECNPAF_750021 [Rhizobium etli CNPAF512]|nr:hypothetical protein RHECNPAF_750021 [Rhizobium etli CNPAF512]
MKRRRCAYETPARLNCSQPDNQFHAATQHLTSPMRDGDSKRPHQNSSRR